MPVATIPAAGIVTLIGVAVAVVAVAIYLFAIGLVLRKVSAGLDEVIGAVGQLPGKTYPIEAVMTSINDDLGAARGVLEGLLIKKLGALPERDALIRYQSTAALPDPAPAPEPAAPGPAAEEAPDRIDYRRAAPDPAPAPEPAAPEPAAEEAPDRIDYRRAAPDTEPVPELAPAAPSVDEAPARIVYRRAAHR